MTNSNSKASISESSSGTVEGNRASAVDEQRSPPGSLPDDRRDALRYRDLCVALNFGNAQVWIGRDANGVMRPMMDSLEMSATIDRWQFGRPVPSEEGSDGSKLA